MGKHTHDALCQAAAAFINNLTARNESIEDTVARYELQPDSIRHVVNAQVKALTTAVLLKGDFHHTLCLMFFEVLLTGAYMHQIGIIPSVADAPFSIPSDML